ncbi:hypothetical protein M8494_04695 [Serratia ureilytica]
MAERLNIALRTVIHRTKVMEKMQATSLAGW